MNCKIEITPEHLEVVIRILAKYLDSDEVTVYVFGSRAKHSAKRRSDLDLAIETLKLPLEHSIISSIRDDFEASLLPYTVDVIDIDNVSSEFKELIKKDSIKLDF